MPKFKIGLKKELFGLIFILLVGVGLRINAAINQSFWRDEVSVFKRSMLPAADLLLLRYQDKSHPQLYYLFLHFWQKFETSPIYLRTPSLIASGLTLVLIYSIGRLVLNGKFGLLSSLFFAVNPFFINLGFQVKFYSFEIFFVTCSIYSLLHYLRDKRMGWAFIGAFFIALAFYTDYSSLWYFGSLLLTVLLHTVLWKSGFYLSPRKFLVIFLSSVILISPGLTQLINNFSKILELESVRQKVQFGKIESTQKEFAGFFEYSNYTFTYILLFICVIFLLKTASQKGVISLFSLFILIAGFVPLVLSYGISQISPILLSRNVWISGYLFIFGPPSFLILSKRAPLAYLTGGLYIIFIFIISAVGHDYFDGRTNWKSLATSARRYDQQQKFLVFLDFEGPYWFRIGPLRDYYLTGYDKDFRIYPYKLLTVSTSDPDFTNQLSSLATQPAVWLLYSGEYLNRWPSNHPNKEKYLETIKIVQELLKCNGKPCENPMPVFD